MSGPGAPVPILGASSARREKSCTGIREATIRLPLLCHLTGGMQWSAVASSGIRRLGSAREACSASMTLGFSMASIVLPQRFRQGDLSGQGHDRASPSPMMEQHGEHAFNPNLSDGRCLGHDRADVALGLRCARGESRPLG